jgi:hypothetical protein
MDRVTLHTQRKAAVDAILAKLPNDTPGNAARAEIRALLENKDSLHQEVAMLRLIRVLADNPA